MVVAIGLWSGTFQTAMQSLAPMTGVRSKRVEPERQQMKYVELIIALGHIASLLNTVIEMWQRYKR